MATKTLNSRIILKHDTEENWLKAENFIPKQGEIIVYDIDDGYNYERFKIGDGVTNVNVLPFNGEWNENVQSDWNENDETSDAYILNKPEIATDDDIIALMQEVDAFPVVMDESGAIMTDEDEAILLA